jgi:hypothetical protein
MEKARKGVARFGFRPFAPARIAPVLIDPVLIAPVSVESPRIGDLICTRSKFDLHKK